MNLYVSFGAEKGTRCLAEVNYVPDVRASRSYSVSLMSERTLGIIELSFIEEVADIGRGRGNCSYLYDGKDCASNF